MLSASEIQRRRNEHFILVGKRQSLVQQVVSAQKIGNEELAKKLLQDVFELESSMCEHDRDRVSNCIACDEIHKEVFPEFYVECANCEELFDRDELNGAGNCDCCQHEINNP